MRRQLLFPVRLLLIWLIIFAFQRLLFAVHFFGDFKGHFGEAWMSPFYGLRLDLSGFSYIMGIPFLVSVLAFLVRSEGAIRILNRINAVFIWIMIILSAVICAGEIVSYAEWHTKLSSKIWIHFTTPSEIFRTASGSNTYWFLFYVLLQVIFAWFIFVKAFKKNRLVLLEAGAGKRALAAVFYFVIGTGLFGLGVRGGWQKIPVSATNAYHSDSQIVNDLTVNPIWNFINMSYTFLKVDLDAYFNHLSKEEAEQILAQVYDNPYPDSTQMVLNSQQPNIIIMTLEGWSAQMIASLGGESGITPNFDQMAAEGVLFTQVYATGGTSETGHSSIMSGYPTISAISISLESAKCRQLPSLNQVLEQHGYSSFYTFGGALSYGNIGGYLADIGFDRLVDENDLDLQPKGELGIHDEAMFPYFLSEVQQAKRPYFYGIFTQSTHAPYDMPTDPYPGYDGDGYVTSMHYADDQLGKLKKGFEALPDFENTLVILVADHGKTNVINSDTYDERFFHIPMLFWGGSVKKECQGMRVDKIGSQADLAKTLLNQLNLNADEFHWSKDLLNPYTPEWAVCTSTLSYGWKDSAGYTVYEMIQDHLIRSAYEDPVKTDEALKKCRAVLECMYREYKEL